MYSSPFFGGVEEGFLTIGHIFFCVGGAGAPGRLGCFYFFQFQCMFSYCLTRYQYNKVKSPILLLHCALKCFLSPELGPANVSQNVNDGVALFDKEK